MIPNHRASATARLWSRPRTPRLSAVAASSWGAAPRHRDHLLPLSHPLRVAEENHYSAQAGAAAPQIRVAANSSDILELMGHMGFPIFVAAQVNSFPKIREYLTIYRRSRIAAGHG